MMRSIGAVILGYVIMFVGVFVAFTAAYLAMGAERSFLPGSYDVSPLWMVVMVLVSLVAAIVGGWVCAAVARSDAAPLVLAVLILVLGIAMALPGVLGEPPAVGPRTGDVGNMQAMTKAQTPQWLTLLNPFIGAFGALLGARFARRRTASAYA